MAKTGFEVRSRNRRMATQILLGYQECLQLNDFLRNNPLNENIIYYPPPAAGIGYRRGTTIGELPSDFYDQPNTLTILGMILIPVLFENYLTVLGD